MINYLAPSLEPYKGCSLLIDVHPGACVWTSKLHDFLKPKRHLLMEPEMRYYDPFIKPLLEKPGSTYRHTTLVGAHAREYWDNYRKALDDPDLVGDRPALDHNDPRMRKVNTDILLTGNLWRKYEIRHKLNYADHTSLLLHHMTYAALTNQIFQRSGLVRMLWWAPDSAKPQIFANSVRSRKTLDSALTMGADITEVAGVENLETRKNVVRAESKRLPEMDLSVMARVKRDMAQRGQETPSGREQGVDGRPAQSSDEPKARSSICETTCKTIKDLNAAITEARAHIEALNKLLPTISNLKKYAQTTETLNKAIEDTVLYPQSIDDVMSRPQNPSLHCSEPVRARAIMIIDLHFRLINLESNYAAVAEANPKSSQLRTCRDKILQLNAKSTTLIDKFTGNTGQTGLGTLISDRASFDASPPTLPRDRRPYEPLQAHLHEFWPNFGLTLLDLQPHERDLSSPGIANRTEGARTCQELLKHLFTTPATSVTASLDRLAPNAAQDLIPMAPAITDARKGGRMDPSKVTVRMLSQEMIEQLVLAFMEWPFKPSLWELALATGEAEGVDGGEGDLEGSPVDDDVVDDVE